MSIRIDQVAKRFGGFQALEPLSLEIAEGEMVGLLGPSGSGKTTLLRIIAGLESADCGRIHFGTRDVTDLHVRQRRVGFVFQNYALFRHMTVAENVAFGLQVLPRRERPKAAEIRARVTELLERVQLAPLAGRYPAQLSGGQKQRIALARALATRPDVLLLDEPFGALDAKVRKELRQWLRGLHEDLHFTSVFVTHDQEEALELSDRVVVMSNGRIEQVDEPGHLYANPNSRFVLDFLGNTNVFQGVCADGRLRNGKAWIALPPSTPLMDGQVYIRTHALELAHAPGERAHLPVRISSINPVGAEVRLELEPVGWHAEQPWEIALPHAAFERLGMRRGEVLHAHPTGGFFFANGSEDSPQTIEWNEQRMQRVVNQ